MIPLRLAPILLAGTALAQGGLAPLPVPPENPLTAEKAVLGKILFWDEQLSANDTVACGTCHRPRAGGAEAQPRRNAGFDAVYFTPDDVLGSAGVAYRDTNGDYRPLRTIGFDVQVTGRAAPSSITSQWASEQFWDGRAGSTFVDPETGLVAIQSGGSLESQAGAPIVNWVEMGYAGRTWGEVRTKLASSRPLALATNLPPDVAAALRRDATYPALFQRAFGTPGITAVRIAFALASYERTLIPDRTPYDRFLAGQLDALTPQQLLGLQAMRSQSCTACHVEPHLTDFSYRNLGLRPTLEDNGRRYVSHRWDDRGKFKVPSLRNVGLRTTFMHNGALSTLDEVLDLYDHRLATFPDNQDPLYALVSVPQSMRAPLRDFLQNALTDPRVAQALPPFDRPTLRSERPSNIGYGGGTAGSGGFTPRLLATQPAPLGGIDFRLGVCEGLGGAPALLFVSAFARTYPGQPVSIDVDLDAGVASFAMLSGLGAGDGYATWPLPLPADPNLRGAWLHAQVFVLDPAAPIGIATSPAVRARVL